MTFRTKLILSFTPIALIPVAVLAFVVRSVMNDRFAAQFDERVTAEMERIERDMDAFGFDLDSRITAIGSAAANDNRFRLAVTGAGDRTYLLDYALRAMQLSGLDVLQIQSTDGRVLTSGHFRNEFDQMLPVVRGLTTAGHRGAVTIVQTPAEQLTAIVRTDSFRLGDDWLHVVGGVRADRFLDLGVTSDDVQISLRAGNVNVPVRREMTNTVTKEIAIPFIEGTSVDPVGGIVSISHSTMTLQALQNQLDRWFLVVFGLTGMLAVAVAVVFASQLSKPLSVLADRTARLDIDNLDVRFETNRQDEIGALTRLLGSMVARIKASASRIREAERRAAVGDLARQINHDIKNGLVPIRNVFDHLTQVQRDDPRSLTTVFGQRQETVTSSIAYLENLASQYARLSPANSASECDIDEVVREAVRGVEVPTGCSVRITVSDGVHMVRADRLAMRRIVENLLGNAIDSLRNDGGVVTLACRSDIDTDIVRLAVADTGRGMTKEDLERAFEDFYTTKKSGTGLGLSVVRRLLGDMGGAIRVETEVGAGTTVLVDLPRATSGASA